MTQTFDFESNGKVHSFDISEIKEPIKQNETSRSLRDYKITTSKEYIAAPVIIPFESRIGLCAIWKYFF